MLWDGMPETTQIYPASGGSRRQCIIYVDKAASQREGWERDWALHASFISSKAMIWVSFFSGKEIHEEHPAQQQWSALYGEERLRRKTAFWWDQITYCAVFGTWQRTNAYKNRHSKVLHMRFPNMKQRCGRRDCNYWLRKGFQAWLLGNSAELEEGLFPDPVDILFFFKVY